MSMDRNSNPIRSKALKSDMNLYKINPVRLKSDPFNTDINFT